jgi:hypothetical protein
MRKMRKLLAAVLLVALTLTCAVPTMACTPPLNPPKVEIPEITVKIDDKLQEAMDAAAKKFLEKNVLEKPSVKYTSYIKRTSRYGTYGCLSVSWNKVDNAISYEVEVTKSDGMKKTYTTSYNAFVRANYYDEFLKDGLENATVRVKAYGENETFSLWSDNVVVTTYNF